MGGVWIGLRKKTPFGPIICQKIERLRKKRLFAGKRETAALEGDLFVIARRTGNKKPLQRTCKGIETGLPVHVDDPSTFKRFHLGDGFKVFVEDKGYMRAVTVSHYSLLAQTGVGACKSITVSNA